MLYARRGQSSYMRVVTVNVVQSSPTGIPPHKYKYVKSVLG